jgi:hypothetical protein
MTTVPEETPDLVLTKIRQTSLELLPGVRNKIHAMGGTE